MDYIFTTLGNLVHQTAFFNLTVGNFIMIFVACFFLYLAIGRGYEPLLLVPIAFGMLLGQSVSGYHENCGGGRCGRQYISGTFALFLSGRRVGHMAVTDLPWCWCHDRLWTADCQSCQLSSGSSSTVWYFLCLYWRYVSWI